VNQSCGLNYDKSVSVLESVEKIINSIENYHVVLDTFIFQKGVNKDNLTNMNANGKNMSIKSNASLYGISGKKMKIDAFIAPPKIGMKTHIHLVYDGIWLWIEKKNVVNNRSGSANSKILVYKVNIPDVSPDPRGMPFHTIYGISGIGLYRYEDFPGTLLKIINNYDFSKNNLNKSYSKDRVLLGKIKESVLSNEKKQYNSSKAKLGAEYYIMSNMKYCTLWVQNDKKRINAYAFGRSSKEIRMYTQVKYLSINSSLQNDVFYYKPPYGIQVKDITSFLLESIKNNEM
jgi:hypothetical protein